MVFLSVSLLLLLLIITVLYRWFQYLRSYWPKRGVPHVPESLYYFGQGKHLAFYLDDVYKNFKNSGHPLVGMIMILMPGVMLIDLDLIKNVFIGDFETFPDRGFYHNTRDDPLSGNIVRLEGEAWRRLRTKLTPTFTSGKMRFMFPTLVTVGNRFTELLGEMVASKAEELEVRDLCARFTTDIIGSVAFGIECNSLRDPNTEFRLKGDKAFKCFKPVLEAVATNFPKLFNWLHVKAFSQELIDFYTKIVTENIDYREKNQIRRNDFLDILIELKNSEADDDFGLTVGEIVAQAFVFFIGGFETSSGTMTFTLYELSKNPEVQEKARRDVLDTLAKHNNELTYESLNDMQYLKQVLDETLRRYPVAPTLKRMARKSYQVPNSKFIIEKDQQVMIPVYAIHHNPEYYPDPLQYNPDRFAPGECGKRHPMAYLPFGAGPRTCIAERFGKMQSLIGLSMLLRSFKFSVSPKTQEKFEYDNANIRIFSVVGGVHLMVEKV